MLRWRDLLIVLWALLPVTGSAGTRGATLHADSAWPTELHGVWRSNGYGWLFALGADSSTVYHYTAGHCWPAGEQDGQVLEYLDSWRLNDDASELALRTLGEPHPFQFTRLAELPAACRVAAATDALASFDLFAELMRSHYAFFEQYQVDWSARTAQGRLRLTAESSERALLAAMREALRGLDDAHLSVDASLDGTPAGISGFRGPTLAAVTAQANARGARAGKARRAWMDQVWTGQIGHDVLGGNGEVAGNGLLQYGLADADVGYLAARAIGGYADSSFEDPRADLVVLEQILDAALDRFARANVRAVIIDLSLNQGGFDFLARAIASRFVSDRRLAYSKSAADAPEAYRTELWIEPAQGKRFSGPVYVLTSDITVSAAEILTLALRPYPHVVHVGTPTRGALSDILGKNLPNGWHLTLSNEVYLDHHGESWEGRGIEPTLAVDVFPEADPAGHSQAVGRIIELITADLGDESTGQPIDRRPDGIVNRSIDCGSASRMQATCDTPHYRSSGAWRIRD